MLGFRQAKLGFSRRPVQSTFELRKAVELERYKESFEILDWVAVGVTVQGPDGNLLYVNDAAAQLMGLGSADEARALPAAEFASRFEILSEDGSPFPLERLPGRIALGGDQPTEVVLRFKVRGSEIDRYSIVQARPVFDDDGSVRFAINVFRDITPIKRAEIERNALLHGEREARAMAEYAVERVTRLQAVTGALAEAITVNDVAHAAVTAGVAALGADAGSIAVHEPGADVLTIVHAQGYERELVERYRTFPLDSSLPLAEAIRKQDVIMVGSQQEREERFPDIPGGMTPYISLAAVPMIIEGRAVGAFGLSFSEPRAFNDEDRTFMLAVAQQCALAIERARLFELERDARQEAETSRERMAFLARASHELATSLDYVKTLSNVARLMVPRMADWVGVDVIDEDGELQQVAVAHIDPAKVELARDMRKRYPPDMDASPGIGDVIRTGKPLFLTEIPQELLEQTARDEEHLEVIRSLQIRSAMTVPLEGRGRIFGAISFIGAESGRIYTEEDLLMAQEVGRRAGLAIDNARLFQETQATEQRLSQLVQNLEAILWEAESSMRCFSFVSKRAEDILGYKIDDWLESEDFWAKLIHPEDSEPVMEYRRMSTQAGEDHTVEYRVLTTTGREIWLRDIAHIVRDESGEVVGLRGLMVDITEQKMVERLLSESRERFAHVARTLQSSLLPPELPAIPGFELAARYRAAGQGNEVGGDFYDAFATEDGKWAVVLGDVMGKGPRAAALTGLARHTLRAVTTRGRGPSHVLRRLNDAILKHDETTTQFATVALAYVWQDENGGKAVISSGGHHLPFILRADGTVEKAGEAGMVLGAFPDPDLTDFEVKLNYGDSIIFYTDGVVEEGEGARTFGEKNLISVIQGSAGRPPSEIAEAIETAVVDFRPEEPRDDIAILALRMTNTNEVELSASVQANAR
jgi:PAS domain S-box-containing protein